MVDVKMVHQGDVSEMICEYHEETENNVHT
jgi:hypothetical protein